MTKSEKLIILFFTIAVACGLLFISLNKYRFYQNYIQIIETDKTNENSLVTNTVYSTDNVERTNFYINKIDINGADLSALTSLPGIGRETALKIIEYRSQKGKFTETRQLLSIKGIGVKKLEKIEKYIIIQ
ncbi:MAG: helix-hairpin-helix domain-containing protein [Spirochaetes bacterium]|nr:helix-hairpin-helix domain-containing protein [Spirochaetota bacterium]